MCVINYRPVFVVHVGCSVFDQWIWSCGTGLNEEQKEEKEAAHTHAHTHARLMHGKSHEVYTFCLCSVVQMPFTQ